MAIDARIIIQVERMTIDERLERPTARHEALTMNLELESREIQELRKLVEIDAENIRALARIAEIPRLKFACPDMRGGSAI